MIKKNKKVFFFLGLLFVVFFLFYFLKIAKHHPRNIETGYESGVFGITYSKKYAEEIGLDWREAYLAMLDDLGVKKIRIPVYWSDIERDPGVFDFDDYNFMVDEASKRDVEIILNFGMRVARWPECHFPSWIDYLEIKYTQERTLRMIESVVDNFRDDSSIKYWQLENEPLLNYFGICPKSDYDFLKKEMELVKKMDDRPVIISATGELSFWKKEAKIADIFGSTMYRIVYNSFFGYIKYPYTSNFYRLKANFAGIDMDKAIVIELQAEPWIPKEDIFNVYDLKYQKSFNLEQFRANVQFAVDTGFSEVYLWGAEWWYFKHKVGDNSQYWNFAKTLFP